MTLRLSIDDQPNQDQAPEPPADSAPTEPLPPVIRRAARGSHRA
jgi:hypothetical protein